ncbi:MAG: helix-turn-helix domain-containing protein [Actinobacteria bacterium]|nr:helix-turn-helix domain-containing protein [Actinomycetota bacterium]MCA1721024.1 helix-turn-helix domain-containing protein [Actinomycetota bacterium]
MTDRTLYARVQRQLPQLASRMIETFLVEVPLYQRLPREQLDGEILEICKDNLRAFFATLQEERLPTEAELAEPRGSAARRAQERVPLDAVLQAYHIGGRIGWAALVAEAKPAETQQLIAAADRVQIYIQAVTGAVATAYLEEQQAISGEERDVRRALAAALMSGQPADALAARAGIDLAQRWAVLTVELAEHDDEKAAGVAGAVAARRKVRRVQACLDEHAGSPVLGLLDAAGGTVFLPDEESAAETLPGLVEKLQAAAGTPVRAGAACSDATGGLASASAQARDVLRLAVRLHRPPGLYLLRDVLLEYQLTHPSDAGAELLVLLDPLERNPDLLLTLDAYLAEDLDRRRTAAALHVHPNTLDYRLKRIVELTGLEPTTTAGLQLLAAASLVRRLTT